MQKGPLSHFGLDFILLISFIEIHEIAVVFIHKNRLVMAISNADWEKCI